jgi:hypothetical protein
MKIIRWWQTGRAAVLGLVMVCNLLIVGCAVVGTTVPAERRISLNQSEGGSGEYKYGKLLVNYNYSLQGSQLTLRGTIDFNWGADSLNVRVLMLDAAGTVLEQKLVYSSGYRTSEGRSMSGVPFSEKLPAPPGTAGISFSYSSKDRTSRR